MSELLKIVQDHLDKTGVSEAEFSRRIGAAPQTVNAWRQRGIRALPAAQHLRGVATVTAVAYEEVLRAALLDTGYLAAGESRGRRHPGAWELGPELMVRLALAADYAEDYTADAHSYDSESDVDEVISSLEQLGYATDELIEVAGEVAELGVGGKTHLAIAKQKERDRRKAVRRAARAVGKRLTQVSSVQRDTSKVTAVDEPAAARRGRGMTKGEQLRDRDAQLGEESQVAPDEED
ncbi:immunity repressor [Gordonia phage ThankyouJordi]|uniref:Immunity repressor n=1 Tax=Gordonia phage ThankyouJordi TaxID=2571252 RepID=A0A4Y6ERQ2_9CAUD|nr:immunity repressor [Gordonia phage ThankyouJordi]QCW22228.1 immunity repressor [Gordonia phage WelcomeAyanna]QDF17804.1 immunity repressor [Gordonia phage ThankyouJordi]